MRFHNLNDWLTWQESLNPAEIELGLERVSAILKQAGLSRTFDCPLIIVAGTNGKGSVVAMLEAIAMAAGFNVCSYTSPHLFQYNERIKINGKAVDHDRLCEAFERIDQARVSQSGKNNQLTYFEFGTLAAIDIFSRQHPDLVILEVGLGGRLDAVNIMDADVSVLTSVAIDHIDWLGDDRETIGFEKAGVFRAGQAVICGEKKPPASVIKQARQLSCEFFQIDKDYSVSSRSDSSSRNSAYWQLESELGDISDLPQPSLHGNFQKDNAATAILALQILRKKGLLFSAPKQQDSTRRVATSADSLIQAIKSGLENIQLAGRFQKINVEPLVYVDVAHNPHAAEALASQLSSNTIEGHNVNRDNKTGKVKTWAIVAMLSDKDVEGVVSSVSDHIDYWCFAGLDDVSRGLSAQALINKLSLSAGILSELFHSEDSRQIGSEAHINQCKMLAENVMATATVEAACQLVLSKANKQDRIIIFGSFYTVTEAIKFFSKLNTRCLNKGDYV